MYAQIVQRVRIALLVGELTPGVRLPSIRGLARRLCINPATVANAYRILARDGFVEPRKGDGVFAADLPIKQSAIELTKSTRQLVREMLAQARPDFAGKELDWPKGNAPPDVAYSIHLTGASIPTGQNDKTARHSPIPIQP